MPANTDLNTWQAIVALTVACIGAWWVFRDAKARGMNPAPWAILTFIALIIGLPLYLLVRPKGKITDCPACGSRMIESLECCPHCEAAPAQPPADNICTGCGAELEEDWKYCPRCGTEKKR